MKQIDKSDKPLLTFSFSVFYDKKIKLIDHSVETRAWHHSLSNNCVRKSVEDQCAGKTEIQSVIHVIGAARGMMFTKHPAKPL